MDEIEDLPNSVILCLISAQIMTAREALEDMRASSQPQKKIMHFGEEIKLLKEQMRERKEEHLEIDKCIKILKLKRKELDMMKNILLERRSSCKNKMEQLQDSLNEYIEVTKDMFTELELGPWPPTNFQPAQQNIPEDQEKQVRGHAEELAKMTN